MAGTRPIRRKERSFNDEIYQHGPFGTIYCHLRRYPVGAHSVRPGSAKSYGSWANNVRPYGSAGADEFTNGVPRSYPKAPSLVALPQQSESTTGRAGTRVAVRLWDCTSQSRQARAQSEGKNGHSMMKSTARTVCYDILPFATLPRRGAHTHRSRRPASNRRRRLLASRSVRPPTNQRQRAI